MDFAREAVALLDDGHLADGPVQPAELGVARTLPLAQRNEQVDGDEVEHCVAAEHDEQLERSHPLRGDRVNRQGARDHQRTEREARVRQSAEPSHHASVAGSGGRWLAFSRRRRHRARRARRSGRSSPHAADRTGAGAGEQCRRARSDDRCYSPALLRGAAWTSRASDRRLSCAGGAGC